MINPMINARTTIRWTVMSAAYLSLLLCSGCVVAPEGPPGPPPPAYGYAAYPASYPWYSGVNVDIGRGWGHGWYGRGWRR